MRKLLLSILLIFVLSGCVETKLDRTVRCSNCKIYYHIKIDAGYDSPTSDLYGLDRIYITRRCNCGATFSYEIIEKTENIMKAEEENYVR